MKLFTASAAILCALGLSACSMFGGDDGPAPGSPAARAPAALPPPMTPAPVPATPSPPAAPVPEDLPAVPAAQVKCIPPFVLQTSEKEGVTEARCVAPQSKPAQPQ